MRLFVGIAALAVAVVAAAAEEPSSECSADDPSQCAAEGEAAKPPAAADGSGTDAKEAPAAETKRKKTKKAKAKAKKNEPDPRDEKARARRGKHVHLDAFLGELAMKSCRAVARETARKKGVKPKKRCEWMVDEIEELTASISSQMKHGIEHTEQDVVDNAAHDGNYWELLRTFGKLSQWLLSTKKNPSEADLRKKLNEALQGTVMKLNTLQKQDGAGQLSPDIIQKLKAQGLNLGSKFDEEVFDFEELDTPGWGIHEK